MGEELEKTVSLQIKRQSALGAKVVKMCDKGENIIKDKNKKYIGFYEFNWYTDFYVMELPCKQYLKSKPYLSLETLEEKDINEYLKIYNESFAEVPNGATYEYDSIYNMMRDCKV